MSGKNKSNFINDKLIPSFQKLAATKHLTALRDGMTTAVPMIIIGSVFMIIAQFPIKSYLRFMSHVFGSNWATTAQDITQASFNLMGLIAVVGISYSLAKKFKVDAISASVVALGCFILTIPLHTDSKGNFWVPLQQLSAQGLFIALIIGLFITDLYVWIVHKNITIKMPATVPPAVANSFVSLIPGFLCLLLVWVIRLVVGATPMKSIPNIINFFLAKPLGAVNNSFWGALIVEFVISLLWFFGIHGANTVSGILQPIWLSAMFQNNVAFKASKEIPNVVSQQFFDCFDHIGGSGATLGFAIMIALLARSAQLKDLGKLVIGPAAFNVNEPIIFGAPVVLNYQLFVPFFLAPLANASITYITMATGLVHKTIGVMVPWTTPPLFSGWLATGHVSGIILQIVLIIIDAAIYYPFFRSLDKRYLAQEKAKAKELKTA